MLIPSLNYVRFRTKKAADYSGFFVHQSNIRFITLADKSTHVTIQ